MRFLPIYDLSREDFFSLYDFFPGEYLAYCMKCGLDEDETSVIYFVEFDDTDNLVACYDCIQRMYELLRRLVSG